MQLNSINTERHLYAILQFEKQRVNYIEEKINGKFEYVTFRMFETQINGQEYTVLQNVNKWNSL